MKKIYWLFGLLLAICYSCSELDNFSIEPVSETSLSSTTRAAGDEKYDVLGYGYDVTGEYLHPLSVRNPVLNIAKYEQDFYERLQYGTSSFGYDKMYYGYSSVDYIKDITRETKATYTMNYGSEKDADFFSNTITNNSYLKTEYSYSSKYSFASLDAIRNLKYIYINEEISRLSQYLSDSFKEDLERLSPERVIERYGTHVLTDFIIGGRYKLLFRSVITNIKDASTKRIAVSSGFKSSLDGIGFNYNLENTDTVNESLIKENQQRELYVLFYGGSGTNLKYDLEKGMPTSVDIQSWEKSISLGNSCLTDINWKETYPIYEFITDPVKKAAIKSAVIKYIADRQIKMLKIIPLYQFELDTTKKFHYSLNVYSLGWNNQGVVCYVPEEDHEPAVPLYQFELGATKKFHYSTNVYSLGWNNQGTMCYIYTRKAYDELVPLYQFELNTTKLFHYNTNVYSLGWNNQGIIGYVFP
ncbi:MAC/perforin domain-containing protein [Bacteroides congonensis]|uniref:MAC/perforin domain-containing protein n=1 Tax=Bacteroides congonensis TaxID=1871006 RepID=UPI00189AE58C|nr:MAC/perforin domain-containing protein [Bacteroides congonensis]